MSAAAHPTVEYLLKRKKKPSLRFGSACFTKSIVETDASEVSAELTEDIAADKMATMRNPRRTCGTSVIMKMGKMKSFALIPEPGRGSGKAIWNGCAW